MKGLILKDLYAMGSFYRNTLFSMIIVCGCFGFSLGAQGVAAATAIKIPPLDKMQNSSLPKACRAFLQYSLQVHL